MAPQNLNQMQNVFDQMEQQMNQNMEQAFGSDSLFNTNFDQLFTALDANPMLGGPNGMNSDLNSAIKDLENWSKSISDNFGNLDAGGNVKPLDIKPNNSHWIQYKYVNDNGNVKTEVSSNMKNLNISSLLDSQNKKNMFNSNSIQNIQNHLLGRQDFDEDGFLAGPVALNIGTAANPKLTGPNLTANIVAQKPLSSPHQTVFFFDTDDMNISAADFGSERINFGSDPAETTAWQSVMLSNLLLVAISFFLTLVVIIGLILRKRDKMLRRALYRTARSLEREQEHNRSENTANTNAESQIIKVGDQAPIYTDLPKYEEVCKSLSVSNGTKKDVGQSGAPPGYEETE